MTATDLITQSLRTIYQLQRPGVAANTSQLTEGLSRVNAMVSGWRTQQSTVIAIEREVFRLTANKQDYTIGLGGDFNISRPLTLNGAGLLLNGLGSEQVITSITRSGTTATVTLASHGYLTGDSIFIDGADQPAYNGMQSIEVITADVFIYPVFGGPASPATAPITAEGRRVGSITRVTTTATVTMVAHGFSTSDVIVIAGAAQSEYNGAQTITVLTVDTFTYTVSGTPATPATGIFTAQALNGQPIEIKRGVITDDAYQAIQIKTLKSSQFTQVYYNPTQPHGAIFLWPCPNTSQNQLVLYLANVFTGFADLTTDYTYPDLPGYLDALQYNLAVRLWPLYHMGVPVPPDIQRMAGTTLSTIKRANYKFTDLPNEAAWAIGGARQYGYNIETGQGGGS